MTKTLELTRWAVHKIGTEQLGYLCSSKVEAEELLAELKSDSFANLSEKEKAEYKVVEVKVEIIEDT